MPTTPAPHLLYLPALSLNCHRPVAHHLAAYSQTLTCPSPPASLLPATAASAAFSLAIPRLYWRMDSRSQQLCACRTGGISSGRAGMLSHWQRMPTTKPVFYLCLSRALLAGHWIKSYPANGCGALAARAACPRLLRAVASLTFLPRCCSRLHASLPASPVALPQAIVACCHVCFTHSTVLLEGRKRKRLSGLLMPPA